MVKIVLARYNASFETVQGESLHSPVFRSVIIEMLK